MPSRSRRGRRRRPSSRDRPGVVTDGETPLPRQSVRFAHNSERQFAKRPRLLRHRVGVRAAHVRRSTEARTATRRRRSPPTSTCPRTTSTSRSPRSTRSWSPRRTARRAGSRAAYPEVQIKVLYQRDYLQLLREVRARAAVAARRSTRAPQPLDSAHPSRCGSGPPPSRRDGSAPPDARSTPTPRSAPHGAFGGWEMPIQYTTACSRSTGRVAPAPWCSTCRTSARCGSPGTGAFASCSGRSPTTSTQVEPGRAQYTHLLDPDDAHVVDDIIVWWVGAGRFLVMPNASNTGRGRPTPLLGGGSARSTTSPPSGSCSRCRARRRVSGWRPCRPRPPRWPAVASPTSTSAMRPGPWPGTGYTGEDGVELHVPGRRGRGGVGRRARRRHHAGRARRARHAAARGGAAAARPRARPGHHAAPGRPRLGRALRQGRLPGPRRARGRARPGRRPPPPRPRPSTGGRSRVRSRRCSLRRRGRRRGHQRQLLARRSGTGSRSRSCRPTSSPTAPRSRSTSAAATCPPIVAKLPFVPPRALMPDGQPGVRRPSPRARRRPRSRRCSTSVGVGVARRARRPGGARGDPRPTPARPARRPHRGRRSWPGCASSPTATRCSTSLIGQGYSGTITPPVIQRNVLENPAWYTAYTPYQPEISQGRLEALLNFQTMVSDLTGMDLANASLLDEATAAAEAMTMLRRVEREAATRSSSTPSATRRPSRSCAPGPSRSASTSWSGSPSPTSTARGRVRRAAAVPGHAAAAATTARSSTSSTRRARSSRSPPTCSRWCCSPRRGSGAPTSSSAPPSASACRWATAGRTPAFFATREEYKRNLPGRLVGVSVDAGGPPGAAARAADAREQHIRREKATSNICTAQVLLANIAGMYAVYHGPDGLRPSPSGCTSARPAGAGPGAGRDRPRARARLRHRHRARPRPADEVVAAARDRGINLRRVDDDTVGIALDETTTRPTSTAVVRRPSASTPRYDERRRRGSAPRGPPPHLADSSRTRCSTATTPRPQMLRYLRTLADRDLALDRTMIPLGSCTMKLNATTEMMPITWPEFGDMHPFAPLDQAEGYAGCSTSSRPRCARSPGTTRCRSSPTPAPRASSPACSPSAPTTRAAARPTATSASSPSRRTAPTPPAR